MALLPDQISWLPKCSESSAFVFGALRMKANAISFCDSIKGPSMCRPPPGPSPG